MSLALIGQKLGVTRIFDETGNSIPVSVVEVLPNSVTQVKTEENDGYVALQVSSVKKKASRVNNPMLGHHKKAGVAPGRYINEFTVTAEQAASYNPGDEIKVDLFNEGEYVDVTGTSIGKGFGGVIKRHNFSGQDNTHGNSLSHRAHGATGQNQTPGRVFKGKKMAGQLGNKKCTVQNLQLVKIDTDRNLLLIKGAFPGAKGGKVIVKPSVKRKAGDKND